MRRSSSFRSGLGTGVLLGIAFFVALALGIGLLVVGYALGRTEQRSAASRPTATAGVSPLVLPTVTVAVVPTLTPPPPTSPPLPTPIPPTETPPPAVAVVGAQGANIRSGPGTNFSKVGYADPNTQLPIIGRYADWWQVQYNDVPAWIANIVVTASNTESVAEVVPPASPVPPPPATAAPTAAPTAVPATAAPVNVRGLVVNGFWTEGGQGPFAVNTQIWFWLDVTNASGQPLPYTVIGVAPKPNNASYNPNSFHTSYNYTTLAAGEHWKYRDSLIIPTAGTYTLVLSIQFADGQWAELGFAPITVQ